MREFHIRAAKRKSLGIREELFSSSGPVVFANLRAARELTQAYAESAKKGPAVRAEDFYAMGLIDEILHYVVSAYEAERHPSAMSELLQDLVKELGDEAVRDTLRQFTREFPPKQVYAESLDPETYLNQSWDGQSGWTIALEELLMLWIENENPAYGIASDLFDDSFLKKKSAYLPLIQALRARTKLLPSFGPDNQDLVEMLRAPAVAHPDSLQQQLEFIRDRWGYLLGDRFLRLLRGIDYLNEVNQFAMNMGKVWGKPETSVLDYTGLEEYERFSPDKDWMPKVVLIAKSTLVWLDQLSKAYGREIRTLDQIPEEELERLAARGFNGLWLIGIWERSNASRQIKNRCGNPDAAASAYSLFDYQIAGSLGGWDALGRLRDRCERRGIRLASDMVPNHTGIDSDWIHNHPERFLQLPYSPFPGYSFGGENLSTRDGVGVYLEDHYYDQSDAAVVFKRVDFGSGETRYIYHGNDGTHMPWNDTAQLDFLNPETRDAVIKIILHVARNFPIIRFDAAMTLAKKHIQRLWYPEPGRAGDIPSRAEHGLSNSEFHQRIPVEFWREVVDRAAQEAPDTLLLAEAFWMMEGYFVRTLGMHRVYNSAFMNMLKNEDNAQYRQTIKNTLEFDKDILKRFVNFMNNPDEETAVAQFGSGDKYFGVCTLMATMPGLPMFGHGQIEGFHEKYGMEYQRAYFNEVPDGDLIRRHEHEIFPLLKKRYLFAEVRNFVLYDFWTEGGWVNENVFAYSNATDLERSLVLYNNAYDQTWGHVKESVGYVEKLDSGDKEFRRTNLATALKLRNEPDCYLVFFEQRSGLWFIRESREIHNRGLFADLPGYSCQVFLNMHEVEDNKFGHYRILCHSLQGRGVKDITQAIRDIILEPVYREFRTLFNDEYRAKFAELLAVRTGKAPKLLAWFSKAMERFLGGIGDFLAGPEVAPRTLDRFARLLENIVVLRSRLADPDLEAERAYLERRAYEIEAPVLSAFVILDALGDQEEEWYLEGKIQEITGQPIQLTALFKWLESYPAWAAEKPATTNLSKALDVYSVVEYLGANYFDGVMWYRRESFQDFAWWSAFYGIVSGPKPTAAAIRQHCQRSASWIELMDQIGYRLDQLADAVKPKSAAKKSTVKPSAQARRKSDSVKPAEAPKEAGAASSPKKATPKSGSAKSQAKPRSKKS